MLFIWPWAWAEGLQIPSSSSPFPFEDGNSLDFASWNSFSCASSIPDIFPDDLSGVSQQCFRFGEADHPGPGLSNDASTSQVPLCSDTVRIGTNNPCGLRGKELPALSLGCGVWGFAETHLTTITQQSFAKAIKFLGQQNNRFIRTHLGAPVSYRSNSDFAGTWSGVGMISDFASQELLFPWINGERSTGRAMVCRHMVNHTPITTGVVYGFPTGPTWPQSQTLNNALLSSLTKDVVIGMNGVRVIMGDFNREVDKLEEFQFWRNYGWVEAQCHANSLWGYDSVQTCKASTTVDHVWLSPEAAMLCKDVGCIDVFSDHSTVYVDLHIPAQPLTFRTWPRPSSFDWTSIDLEAWHLHHASQDQPFYTNSDPTEFLSQWAHSWETSLSQSQEFPLPPHQLGRAQRTEPMMVTQAPLTSKPSRPGEEALRSDVASGTVHRWFRQLRRLQSYKHAIIASKPTPAAEEYRISLWRSIRKARGFGEPFDEWWHHRQHRNALAPDQFPLWPPDQHLATIIFEDFRLNFKKLELWHLRQRQHILKAKHEKSCHQLFQELKPPQRDQLDLLWQQLDFTVLDFEDDSCQIHLDRPIPTTGQLTWHHERQPLRVVTFDNDLLTCDGLPLLLAPGDTIVCTQHFSSHQEIHAAMIELWKPRWQRTSEVGSEAWDRITRFTTAFMPKIDFPSPDFSLCTWKSTLARFPARPARGVDGIAVADLCNLPDPATYGLLSLLQRIDGSTYPWPKQLLQGVVISLSKRDAAHLPSHFRPVVIFSCIYRAWARLCAQPILRRLSQVVSANAFGFLPGRECTQIWMLLQSYIELGHQQNIGLSGFSTDLEKCFNLVGRDQLHFMAKHVGLPESVLGPWFGFLTSCGRSFQLGTTLSESVSSTQGLPEGCSLSVIGMILIDWSFHTYMSALNPHVHCYSYVDNVSVLAHQALDVVAAFFSTISFFQLWGLCLDRSKTYFWGTLAADRQLLELLGMTMKQDAVELGGCMTFTAAKRTRHLKSRAAQLTFKWTRLKMSFAPLSNKLRVLSIVFWPAALYGSPICPVSSSHFHDLRKMACKSLRLNKAGSNSILRLSMSDHFEADPEFYHTLSVFRTFRRVCGRSRQLLVCWQLWFQDYAAKVTNGPFSVLLQTMHTLGWTLLEPPMFQDHDGLVHDFLLLPWQFLCALADDAWLLHITHGLRDRATMKELFGIDRCTSSFEHNKLTSHERSLVSSLQSGAFIDAWTHGKYDVTKISVCSVCNVPDTHSHLLVCSKYAALRDSCNLHPEELQRWPVCTTHHLLVPRAPYVEQLRSVRLALDDSYDPRLVAPTEHEIQHIFTDGSFIASSRPETSCASWSVFLETRHQAIATGPLIGFPQTIGRAELTAMIRALQWVVFWQVRCHLWIDAKFVHQGLARRLSGHKTLPGERNYDLWYEVDVLLQDVPPGMLSSSWIPSHLSRDLCENPMEEWISSGNGSADSLAVRENQGLPKDLRLLLLLQRQWDQAASGLISKLRRYYFALFELRQQQDTQPVSTVVNDSEEESFLYSISEVLMPIDLDDFVQTTRYPASFLTSLITWIQQHESDDVVAKPFSYIELCFALLKIDPVHFPQRSPISGQWEINPGNLFERPTLAFYLKIVQSCCRYLGQHCDPSPVQTNLNRSHLGITFPVEGLLLRIRPVFVAHVHSLLAQFTCARAIRRCADLARPI